jgi:hypothetical protein
MPVWMRNMKRAGFTLIELKAILTRSGAETVGEIP